MLFDTYGALTLDQSRPGSNCNKGALHIPQNSSTGVSPSDCLVSYLGHSLKRCLTPSPSVEIQSVYSTAPVD